MLSDLQMVQELAVGGGIIIGLGLALVVVSMWFHSRH